VDSARLLVALRSEGELLLASARADLTAPVPACPGWVVGDVAGHLGRVYRSIGEIVATGATEPPTTPVPKPPAGDAVLDFFAEGHRRLLELLAAADPSVPIYTWSDERSARFYVRRMAHETAVHRIDVEHALGRTATPVDSDVATDGLDELYGVVLPFGLRRRPATVALVGSLHLHRTDGPGEWTLELVDGVLRVGHVHGKATAAVRGPASALFTFAWNRGVSPGLEVFGDRTVADAWAGLAP
jgi:uncharacterized protein (TIGR03083 family)